MSQTPTETPWGIPHRRAWLAAAPDGVMRHAFDGLPEYVAEARKVVSDLFTGTGREDDAALIVDELVNNAILYTRSGQKGGWFGVEITFGNLVRVGVADLGGAGWLIGSAADDEAGTRTDLPAGDSDGDLEDVDIPGLEGLTLGGRGLSIIAALALATGACGSPHIGHTVWADLVVTCPPDPFPVESPTEAVIA